MVWKLSLVPGRREWCVRDISFGFILDDSRRPRVVELSCFRNTFQTNSLANPTHLELGLRAVP